jgi:tellurite resistance protein
MISIRHNFSSFQQKNMAQEKILEGYTDMEKGAYLGAIASIATADREASPEEIAHIEELCDAAGLSQPQKQMVVRASTELQGEELNRCLDVLKNSDLKYSLVTDLMAFAKADADYSEEEEKSIQNISRYLGLDQKQFSLLNEFSEQSVQQMQTTEEPVTQNNFLGGGLKEKLQGANINTSSLFSGLIGLAAPMLLSGMLSRGLGGRRGGLGGGGFGGGLGSGLGGLGMGGGLGSLIGMLGGGRMGNLGGLFGRRLGGF